MEILLFPWSVLLWLVATAIDVVLFFVLVRLLSLRWSVPWIVTFDAVGRPLVNGLLTVFEKIKRGNLRRLREGPKLVLCMAILWTLGLLVAWLRHAVLMAGGGSDGNL